MKAIIASGAAAGSVGISLAERPEPAAAINDVIVEVHDRLRRRGGSRPAG